MRYKVGDRVRFTDAKRHRKQPKYFPPAGTVGTVYEVDEDGDLWVRWEDHRFRDGTGWSVTMPERVEPIPSEKVIVKSE